MNCEIPPDFTDEADDYRTGAPNELPQGQHDPIVNPEGLFTIPPYIDNLMDFVPWWLWGI